MNSYDICNEWKKNKLINPITKYNIKYNGPTYNKLNKKCESKISSNDDNLSINEIYSKKFKKIITKNICYNWNKNKEVNPFTNRAIKKENAIYKEFLKLCNVFLQKEAKEEAKEEAKKAKEEAKKAKEEAKKPKEEAKKAKEEAKKPKEEAKKAKEEAKKPKEEAKKAKEEAKKAKEEAKKAKEEAKKPKEEAKKAKEEAKKAKEEAKKPKEEAKKPKEEAKKPLNSNKAAIILQKNIKHFFYPYINRVSTDINDRIIYYIKLLKELKIKNEKNTCVKVYKFDNKSIIYRLGNKIILKKQIGSPSSYGIVFLSEIRDKKTKKLYKFAVKITQDTYNNSIENDILNILTKAVIKKECPHFPILYKTLYCKLESKNKDKSDYSDESSDNSLNKFKTTNLLLPEIVKKSITKKKNLYIFINEIANGDFKSFIPKYNKNDKIILNAVTQIILSLFFYYKTTKSFHNDSHWGNFLYHKIKPGGYLHYKIGSTDFYLENLGYLWVIWDFGSTLPFIQTSKTHINSDLNKLLGNIFFSTSSTKKNYPLTKNAYGILDIIYKFILTNTLYNTGNNLKIYIQETINLLIKLNLLNTKKPSHIINSKPFILL
jgi:hypothetical protein